MGNKKNKGRPLSMMDLVKDKNPYVYELRQLLNKKVLVFDDMNNEKYEGIILAINFDTLSVVLAHTDYGTCVVRNVTAIRVLEE